MDRLLDEELVLFLHFHDALHLDVHVLEFGGDDVLELLEFTA